MEVIQTLIQCVKDLIDDRNTQLNFLSTIAENQPQAAYVAFVSAFSKLNYFMRKIPRISHHLVSLGETLCNRFIPAITGGYISNDTDKTLLSLPTRFSGLAIPIFYEQAKVEYSNS